MQTSAPNSKLSAPPSLARRTEPESLLSTTCAMKKLDKEFLGPLTEEKERIGKLIQIFNDFD